MTKISVIGAGAVGAQVAFLSVLKQLGDVVLIDIAGDMAKGKALDLFEATPVLGVDAKIRGGDDYEQTKNSDVIIITAGLPRKPGMTREDLLKTNANIVKEVTENVCIHSPNAILLVMTNPLDAMTYVALKASKFPRERVIGQAGILDSSRFRSFIAEQTGVSVNDIQAMVLGSHGEQMVPVPSLTTINGKPIREVLDKEAVDALVERTRKGGAEIVELLKTGSAFFAPAASIVEMTESILKDQKKEVPCSVQLAGEYSVNCCIGVPVVLGKSGVGKVVELELSAAERAEFKKAAESIQEMQRQVDEFLG